MADQALIVAELKRALRERGLTYAAVAAKLALSVASVKRLFSSGDLSLKRVDQICELLETGLADILAQARESPSANQLTLAQEQEIVAEVIPDGVAGSESRAARRHRALVQIHRTRSLETFLQARPNESHRAAAGQPRTAIGQPAL